MGTSHRHTPGVSGEPNWGKASSSITGVANTEIKLEDLENNPPKNKSNAQIEKKQTRYSKSISTGYHRSVRSLVRAAGGRSIVSSGSSKALGHAGISLSSDFVHAIADIAQKGLNNWLKEKGFGVEFNRSRIQIMKLLREYLSRDVVGMDDTAANEAFEHTLDKLEEKIKPDASNFDEVMKATISHEEIVKIIDEFIGIYIYCHLSQDFKEKLEHEKGTRIAKSTMNEIKDLILDDVRRGFNGRNAEHIDWTGKEGTDFVKHEFDRIIYILSGNED